MRVHGLDLSYFSGKLQAYLRSRGIVHDWVEMDSAGFRACAAATGVAQMPQVELDDGRWLTDTTPTIAWLEDNVAGPRITPADPVVAFAAALIEDWGDEGLWRPALYYRWAFDTDARLMSGRIADEMLRDVPLPRPLRRQFILRRQRRVYLAGEGVTRGNRAAVEALYGDTLALLESLLAARRFVLGDRPTVADFGLFGPMFRHFFCDPTPARVMRDRAPNVALWVTRLWALSPADWADSPAIDVLPDDLGALFAEIGGNYLPWLKVNADAVAADTSRVTIDDHGGQFRVRPSRYRAWCLDRLQAGYAALTAVQRAALPLPAAGGAVLTATRVPIAGVELPIVARGGRAVDRAWG